MRISDWSSDVCSSDLRDPRWGPGLDAVDLQADVLFPVGRLASVACADEIAVAAVAHRGNPRRRRRVADQLRRAGAEPGRRQEAFSHRSEEHTSELQSLMRISYAVFCLKKKKKDKNVTS